MSPTPDDNPTTFSDAVFVEFTLQAIEPPPGADLTRRGRPPHSFGTNPPVPPPTTPPDSDAA
jgi:hypothetical protein